jgi:dTDP-4-amino-4,6-dideoxygalactose transaminase
MLLVAQPILGEEEKAALSDVVDSNWITMGDRVREFELAFAKKHDAADSVAVSSCTAALHLILEGLGIGSGDEVLLPSLTFVATANCVLYVGATPVFVDIESFEHPLMSLTDAAAKCTDKTKAVIVMHYAGYVADRDGWRQFAESRGLVLIEDAAHAAGADQVGTFGHAAAFSFYGNKNMTTAEGGMVIAHDEETLARIRQMRGHGMTSGTFQRLSSRTASYDVTMLGYNYRMDELRAALGLTQLERLAPWNEKRKRLTLQYRQSISERCPKIGVPFAKQDVASNYMSAYHIMPIVLPRGADRQSVVDALRDAEIQTTIHYPPVHLFSLYRSRFPDVSVPRTEAYSERELTLPLHPNMEDWHIDKVAGALATAIGH